MQCTAAALCMAQILIFGCSSVHITLRTDETTNQGRPLQVVVRSVDEATYRTESYAAIAKLVTTTSDSVLRKLVIDPGTENQRSFRVTPARGQAVALYLLYTEPTGNWRMLLPPPLPYSIMVPLGRRGITVEEVQEHRLRSPDATPVGSNSSAAPNTPQPPTAPSIPALPSIPLPPSVPPPPALPNPPSLPSSLPSRS